ELGLMRGQSATRMQGMEKVAYTLLQQAEELGNKLKTFRPTVFFTHTAEQRAYELELEATDLTSRADRYLQDLSGIGSEMKRVRSQVELLGNGLAEVSGQIRELIAETGF